MLLVRDETEADGDKGLAFPPQTEIHVKNSRGGSWRPLASVFPPLRRRRGRWFCFGAIAAAFGRDFSDFSIFG